MGLPRVLRLGPLGRRLTVAFVLVAAVALGTVAALAGRAVRQQTVGLDAAERARAERRIVAALADAYAAGGSWDGADLTAARALAQAAGLQVVVLNAAGGGVATVTPTAEPRRTEPSRSGPGRPTRAPASARTVPHSSTSPGAGATSRPGWGQGTPGPEGSPSHPGQGAGGTGGGAGGAGGPGGVGRGPSAAGAGTRATSTSGPAASAGHWVLVAETLGGTAAPTRPAAARSVELEVVVDGHVVGRALVETTALTPTPAARAGDAILAVLSLAAAAALALAVGVALFVSYRITRPLTALVDAAVALERGDPDATALLRPGPGELGTVAKAFSSMAGSLRREDELRRALTADVAHELRTPVTVLRGATEEVLDGVSPLTRETVESLHEEALRLERLVEDLASLSAAEAAGLRLVRVPVDLRDVVRHAAGALRPRFDAAGQQLQTRLPPAAAVVLADQLRLEQVLTNLLVNAQEYTPAEGLVTVDVDRSEEPAGWRITVEDSGPGIAQEDLPRVFQRFFRGRGREGRHGTGIGLAVVAELVAAHGGSVRAASRPGGGAVFTVTLPQ